MDDFGIVTAGLDPVTKSFLAAFIVVAIIWVLHELTKMEDE